MPDRQRSAGPRWTRKRLVDTLAACYGRTPRGAVRVDAVAEDFEVTPRTVQRWMHGQNRQNAHIPERRLAQLMFGDAQSEVRRLQQAAYAREAIAQIALPKQRGILPAWRDRGWLDPHVVAVIAVHARPWRQVVVSNGTARSLEELRRRGDILDITTLPTRFHAVVLANEVMALVQPWRIHPSTTRLTQGRYQVFAHDAPPVDLSVLAVSHGLR
ncbi:MAG TPA: hypothetical protein VIW24_20420 [Aldersonia sp.]